MSKRIVCIMLALALAFSVFTLGAAAEELTVYKTVVSWASRTVAPKDQSQGETQGYFHGFESSATTCEAVVEDDEVFIKFTLEGASLSRQYIHVVYPAEGSKLFGAEYGNYNCIRFRVKNGENGLGFCPRFDFVNTQSLAACTTGFNNMLLQSKDGEILWDDTEYLNPYEVYLPSGFDGYVLCIMDEENYVDLSGGTLETDGSAVHWPEYRFQHMPFFMLAADEGTFMSDEFWFGTVELCNVDLDEPTPTAEPTATPAPATEAPT
ncbi:MAG: hypothetical protein KIG36_03890, partial [Eubacteriales bacterium]|nr:hypothetical protein [Eubacteriales bacterium]